jgi:lipoprotein signal peptidase
MFFSGKAITVGPSTRLERVRDAVGPVISLAFRLLKWCIFAGLGAATLVYLRGSVHWAWLAAGGVALLVFLGWKWSQYGFLALYLPQAGNTAKIWAKRVGLLVLAALGVAYTFLAAASLALTLIVCVVFAGVFAAVGSDQARIAAAKGSEF